MAVLQVKKIEKEVANGNFRCGNDSIDSKVSQSYWATILQHAYAFQIEFQGNIIGYYMIQFKNINLEECPEYISDYYIEECKVCTSVHITYIAIDMRMQKQKIGTEILKKIIIDVKDFCTLWPIRLITLDALVNKIGWYKEIGFKLFHEEKDFTDSTARMYLDCLINEEVVNNYGNYIKKEA